MLETRHTSGVLERIAERLYERLGRRYWLACLVTEGPLALFVVVVTIWLFASYYDPSLEEFTLVLGIAGAASIAGVGYALFSTGRFLARVVAWQDNPAPSAAETAAAWDAATNFTMRSFRRNVLMVAAICSIPSAAGMVVVLDLSWAAMPALLAACVVPFVYGTILNYSAGELLMRPVIRDISRSLSDDFPFTANGLPVRKRFIISLPTFTAFTGIAVAALMTDGGGTELLAVSVLVSLVVGMTLSFELTLLLSQAITDPIARLRGALARVREGDYSVRVPVMASDELGELSHDFNLMAQGLAEREQLREAFGTYLDHDVARFILDGNFPDGGVEVDVSIMFCDVRGFTSFAEQAEASEVVTALNALFETIVPIVDRHGGHVDKFIGDGLLAVFGAPEGYEDHADRAVAAARDIVAAVNGSDPELRVAVGVNSGRVVAGSIGGAGRLNFSVIGDAVNTAARVEAATRETGDDLLVTSATRDAMRRPIELTSRGTVTLKGKAEPVEVCAPVTAPQAAAPAT